MANEPPAPAKRGRPRVPEPGVNVSSWVRQADYDRICQIAKRQDMTVSKTVRALIARGLR